jgi:hypothetical protein
MEILKRWIHSGTSDEQAIGDVYSPAFVDVTDDYNEFNECIQEAEMTSLTPHR